MRKVFAGLAAFLLLVLVVQFFLAASGAFSNEANEEAFRPHRILGLGSILVAVVLTVAAAVMRMPGRIIGLSGLVAGLGILQALIAVIAKAFGDSAGDSAVGRYVFGLHAVNGLVMVAVARVILRSVRAAPDTTTTSGVDTTVTGPAADSARTAS
ncbi:DUF6220 domain-containing protein [Micromonospora chalcea]|uniref:DUF6220 domain-containing protein n=1 Tax=Micromonospora sp. TSRI0369 TaxID=1703936 RepID=UPI00093D1054|nr:DUF6220 domain-containing protein [Micromonospora sp. TSRI0369]OKJ45357.1 hypothetical protein AMK25_10075 [Micromonospora sp. TSRI0369]